MVNFGWTKLPDGGGWLCCSLDGGIEFAGFNETGLNQKGYK
jgi:hypothetical protein